MRKKIIIADSDRKSRNKMASLLQETHFHVLAEASNGLEAKDCILRLKPDVIFLDSSLPEIDGLTLGKQIRELLPETGVVLVSASSEFAYDAFEIEAIDYLMKPLHQNQLITCCKKIDLFLKGKTNTGRNCSVIGFKHQGEIEFFQQNQIVLISSENRQTKVFVNTGNGIKVLPIKESLTELEEKMDPSQFVRTHRSFIININYLAKIYPSGQTYIATFKQMKEIAHISKNLISKVYNQPDLIIIQ